MMENQNDQITTEAQQQQQQHPSRPETSATIKVNETNTDNLASNQTNSDSNEHMESLDDNKDDLVSNDELVLEVGVEEKNYEEQQQQQQLNVSISAEHSIIGDPESPLTEASELPDEETGSEKSRDSANGNLSSHQDRSNQSSKSGQDNNIHQEEGASLLDGEAASSALGRNRRVRQKNRYFLDFHCIDLTKGGRSKEDFSYSQAANIRATTRRSTTDSSRGLQEDPDVSVETKYCRKCSTRTAHDSDGGCQVCLYNKIVSSSRRQRQATQKSRSTTRQQQQLQQQPQQKQNQHDKESGLTTTTSSNKRKATRQGGGPAKLNNNFTANILSLGDNNLSISGSDVNRNDVEANNVPDTITNNSTSTSNHNNINSSSNPNNVVNKIARSSPMPVTTITSATNPTLLTKLAVYIAQDKAKKKIKSESVIVDSNDAPTNGTPLDLPLIDSWTPDEVAKFIQSIGFTDEAESFKTESVDGISLLLMQRTDFTYGLSLKLGPALKIYDQVCKLKREYFQKTTTATI